VGGGHRPRGAGREARCRRFKIDYPNDDWDALVLYKWIGDGFQPSLGFAPRIGVQQFLVGATRRFRPAGGPVNDYSFGLYSTTFTTLSGEWESWNVEFSPNVTFRSGDEISFEVTPQGERLVEPFEVSDGVVIAPGEYGWVRGEVEVETASKRAIGAEVRYGFGGFYDGTLQSLAGAILVRRLQLRAVRHREPEPWREHAAALDLPPAGRRVRGVQSQPRSHHDRVELRQ
jgi:hypothetical protein